ncbi:hypothetical protein PIB30_049001 [Stylosanthes scabra]|uniref:PB1-like domain-containing protein n=1 Tax=Stylosanthes scabra TaxID=79078 RepID=A0ABU6ZFY3_9FABA|nr:hypothetical protein [Stylosanthes scabra]
MSVSLPSVHECRRLLCSGASSRRTCGSTLRVLGGLSSSFSLFWCDVSIVVSLGSFARMDAFVVPVIFHGGRLERLANREFSYVDGEKEKFPSMDVDFVNKEDLLILIRELGYVELSQLY